MSHNKIHSPGYARDLLSRETGVVKKKWQGRLAIGLVFPNSYGLGMSNLGFQLVYAIINRHPGAVGERFFLPAKKCLPFSLESNRPLRDFPVIFISVSFEQDYLNLISMLRAAGIPPLAEDRPAGNTPLIIAGGVATFINPEPLVPFVDLFVVGEAEPILPALIDYLIARQGCDDKESLLFDLATRFPGCYAPRFYHYIYDAGQRFSGFSVSEPLPLRIRRHLLAREKGAGHSQILSPAAEFSDMFLVELGRGCSRGCRFCAAGFVYRPPRLWSGDTIITALDARPENINRVGLLGMEMVSEADLTRLTEYFFSKSCLLSFSSLRADAITPGLLTLLSKSNLKSVTLAPDGASERLRQVINKGLSEEDVVGAAEALVRAGIQTIKLYFMIGLPTETREDIEELVSLVLKIKSRILEIGRSRGRMSNLVLSINSFVPKPWTPFQWHPYGPVPELKERLRTIRKALAKVGNIKVMSDQPAGAYFQSLIARGDRKVGMALLAMIERGKGLKDGLEQAGILARDYVERPRERNEAFPWEIIDHGIKRVYLWAEYQRALQGKSTPACLVGTCRRCGVCK